MFDLPTPKTDYCLDLIIKSTIMKSEHHKLKPYKKKKKNLNNYRHVKLKNLVGNMNEKTKDYIKIRKKMQNSPSKFH